MSESFSLFTFPSFISLVSVDIVVRQLLCAQDKTDRIQTVLAKLIDMSDCVPRSHENSRKQEKEAENRAVTRRVDQLVQKCDYLYIETVNRIYLQFVRYDTFVSSVNHRLRRKPFTSSDYNECPRNFPNNLVAF